MSETRAVWGARLAAGLDPRARILNDSLPVDGRLWPEELALTRAYALALVECGVMSDDEATALAAACDALADDLERGAVTLEGEDVHSAVEAELTRRTGDAARKIHTGRSRNDQVGTLMRMHVMRRCELAMEAIRHLEAAIVAHARKLGAAKAASFTHLQPAQPVLAAHAWLAHANALERDEERFAEAREAAAVLPLGAGAVAGTPLQYDRPALAMRLGFSRLATNSIDAVGDRDYALQYLQAGAMLGIHLSRLAEDLVLWISPAFGWYRAPDGFSTGSSLLPQKRNPDVFELARGKSARLISNAERLAVLLKGLPSSYQKDLQEDKEAVFDTADTIALLLDALEPAIAALEPNIERMAASLTPDLLAVELADALTAEGVPFRDAHAQVGKLWAVAESAGVTPSGLPEADRLAISPHFTDARLAALTVEKALERRNHAPGAGPISVAHQLARFESRLGLRTGDPEGMELSSGRVGDGLGTSTTNQAAAAMRAGPKPSAGEVSPTSPSSVPARADGIEVRRAKLEDVPGIAAVMADYVIDGTLLPRPTSELYQCIREFHVAVDRGQIVACGALRLLWSDLGEVRSLAVLPSHQGKRLGAEIVKHVVEDARALELPRVIALTKDPAFFERCGFTVATREVLPRKVWTDCVRCPKRHACDEVAVVMDLVPGASEEAAARGRTWVLPIPQPKTDGSTLLPIVS
jgi:argininosuccinate lyase/amino-acid N-acetyltransferase